MWSGALAAIGESKGPGEFKAYRWQGRTENKHQTAGPDAIAGIPLSNSAKLLYPNLP
jgi:hypothetical protein